MMSNRNTIEAAANKGLTWDEVKLVRWIEGKGGAVTAGQLSTDGPRCFRKRASAARQALQALVDAGIGWWVDPQRGKNGQAMVPRFVLRDAARERDPATSRDKPDTHAHPSPTVTLELVTPEKASLWLGREQDRNVNRSVSDAHVQRLARDMASGDWKLTHEGIAFDPDDVLIDGQHRLWAVIYADTPIEMYIWRGVTRDALMAIDTGRPRSLPDVLNITGEHHGVDRSQVAVLRAMLGGRSGAVKLSPAEASEAYRQHVDAIRFAVELLPKSRKVSNAATRAVLARAYYSCDHGLLKTFAEMLLTGVVDHPSAIAIAKLREFLFETRGGSGRGRLAIEQYAKTQRALVAFLGGEKITRLHAAREEHFPLPEEAEERTGLGEGASPLPD